jgi:RNA polymerase sigma factor (sigma-70 family)
MSASLEGLVRVAREGDRDALESVVSAIQDRVYGLALRMLWHPEDARDATQEILIRIVTRLSTFRGASAFSTWAYRVAANYLLTARKSRLEERRYTFQSFGEELDQGLSDNAAAPAASGEMALLLEEIKVACTLAMLTCLDRPHRLAYILGEILEMDGDEAGRVLSIGAAAYRKRLSRARQAVVAFTRAKCGLVNPERPCRCRRRLSEAVRVGRVTPGQLIFASDAERARQFPKVLAEVRRLEGVRRAAALFRSHPDFTAPADLAVRIRKLVEGGSPITEEQGSVRGRRGP